LHCRILSLFLQVTLQSFLWSPRVKEKGTKAEVEALIQQCQGQLQEAPGVAGLADLARATPADVASVMVRATSGAGGTVDASVKRVIIGKVRLCYAYDGYDLGLSSSFATCYRSPVQRAIIGKDTTNALWLLYGSDGLLLLVCGTRHAPVGAAGAAAVA
jgi:hypothetical protein